jgi:hypothetical protein
MESAAHQIHEPIASAWRVSREGEPVAAVDVHEHGGNVVVSATVGGTARPYRFDSVEAADTFVRDLVASFAYLGCDVAVG